jgi:uncharacterized Tic20 family protein
MDEQQNINPIQPIDPESEKRLRNERNWAMFCHLGGLALFLGIPLGNIVAPLIIWLIKKDEMPLVDESGKEALNFQISMTIYFFLAALLVFVLIGFLLIFPLVIADIVLVIVAAVKTSSGEKFVYPLSIKFLR